MSYSVSNFLPYLLNRAAEQSSVNFQKIYKDRFGMLRNEWRVLFHLGLYGALTASTICQKAGLHKTKVSRAVAALEAKSYLIRDTSKQDKRFEILTLTRAGENAFSYLSKQSEIFQADLMAHFTPDEQKTLLKCLFRLQDLKSVT